MRKKWSIKTHLSNCETCQNQNKQKNWTQILAIIQSVKTQKTFHEQAWSYSKHLFTCFVSRKTLLFLFEWCPSTKISRWWNCQKKWSWPEPGSQTWLMSKSSTVGALIWWQTLSIIINQIMTLIFCPKFSSKKCFF